MPTLNHTPIQDLVPHRGPSLLVDRLLQADGEHAVVEADIAMASRWVRDGAVPSWLGIEIMAQAIAAWAGACALREGRPVPLGFLLGTRRYDALVPAFEPGSTLRISVRREFVSDDGLGLFDCRIDGRDRTLATAQLSVFEPADTQALLQRIDDGGSA